MCILAGMTDGECSSKIEVELNRLTKTRAEATQAKEDVLCQGPGDVAGSWVPVCATVTKFAEQYFVVLQNIESVLNKGRGNSTYCCLTHCCFC